MVSVVAIAVPAINLDPTNCHLDVEYYPDLLCLASASTGTAVEGPAVDSAARIRVRSCNGYDSRFAAEHAIPRFAMFNEPVKTTGTRDSCIH